jgi:hypothetical protein
MLAGCVEGLLPGEYVPGASQWQWSTETSMYPDFTDDGPVYPVLLVHSHTTLSQQEKEYYEQNPVVCLMLDDDMPVSVVAPGAAADAVACMPPAHDAATGRLFVDNQTFDDWGLEALLIRPGCGSLLTPLTAAEPGFRLPTPEHDFRITWDDGVFRVDDRILRPGEALKITYWIDYGDAAEQKMVRVVLDYPGGWLRTLVAPAGSDEPLLPQPPGTASGLQVLLPHDILDLPSILDHLGEAAPAPPTHIEAVRVAYGPEGLRDVQATLGRDVGTVTWYLASREGDNLRLLGNYSSRPTTGALVDALAGAFPAALSSYGETQDAVSVSVQWTPQWAVAASPLLGAPGLPCQDCLYAWGASPAGDAGWQSDPLAQRIDAASALSLHVTAIGATGSVHTALYSR